MESNTNPQALIGADQSKGMAFDLGSLLNYLQRVEDKRKPKGLRYPLATILVLIILAKLCGQDKPSGIAEWAQNRTQMLAAALKLKRKKMPHHSTYRRILEECLYAEQLQQLSSEYLLSRPKAGRSVIVALDGKTVRGTIDAPTESGVHLLAVYLPEEGLVLAQVAVDSKENEIAAAPRVLEMVDLRGKVLVGDAMHTQRKLSIQVVLAGGDYVWTVKGNQHNLHWDLHKLFEETQPIPGTGELPKDFRMAKTVNKGHGRIEERCLTASSLLKDYVDWPYLEQVFKLERRFTYLKSGKIMREVRYGITSLPAERASPKRLLHIVRSLWGMENGLHYRRDATLQEDRTRLTRGNAGQVMAVINNLVLGLLALKGYSNVASARRWFDAQPLQALRLITLL
jgi:predicted transposase YbfD/YdcC